MDWIQVITIILSLAGITYWFKSELEKDIQRIDSDMKSNNEKLEKWIQHSTSRSDQLYEMFIQLLKESKERKNP